MKRTLIVGSGRIGNALSAGLAANGAESKVLSSRLATMQLFHRAEFHLESFDSIIWAARDSGIPSNSINSASLFYELLEFIESSSWAGFFVFISSAGEIYGETKYENAKEVDPVSPLSTYGKMKAKHEIMISTLVSASSLRALILRVSSVYELSLSDPGVVGAVLRSLLLKEYFELQGGAQTRDFIALSDLVISLVKLYSIEATGIFNVASGKSFSINELISILEAKSSREIISTKTTPFKGILNSRIAISKLQSVINWSPSPLDVYVNENDIS